MLVINLVRRKSLFGKIFTINIITIVIGLTLAALLQYVFIIQLIDEELKSNLRENASDISRIITAVGYLEAGIEPELPGLARFRLRIRGQEPFTHIPEVSPLIDRAMFLENYLDAYTLSTGNYVIIISNDGQVTMSTYVTSAGKKWLPKQPPVQAAERPWLKELASKLQVRQEENWHLHL